MTTHKANGHSGHDPKHGSAFAAFARSQGYVQELAWILRRDGEGEEKPQPEKSSTEGPATEEPQSETAKRKRKQRNNDRQKGWAQCNVKAPIDDDARALMAEIGIGIKNPEFRAAIRIATKNPELVMYGASANALQGLRGHIVRVILGKPTPIPTHNASGL